MQVELGKLLSAKAGLERKAEVIAYDQENFVTRSGGFDCILSLDTLFRSNAALARALLIADTRTNAGLDNVSTFRKLHVFGVPGQRIMALASSGNLSLSQSVVSTLTGEEAAEMRQRAVALVGERTGATLR